MNKSMTQTEGDSIMELTLLEQVHQAAQGDWIYRFRANEQGVLVRRVHKDRVIWNHGVLVQMFDRKANSFLPSNVCGLDVYFRYMDEAIAVVKAQS